MTPYERQLELEREMRGLGIKRFWERVRECQEAGRESQTGYGIRLAKECLIPLAERIKRFQTEGGQGQNRSIAKRYLVDLDPEVVSLITLRVVLDGISARHRAQAVAIAIASAIEDERRFTLFDQENHALWDKLTRDLNSRTKSRKHKSITLKHMMIKAAKNGQPELIWNNWPKVDKHHLGMKCLDFLIETTGLVELDVVAEGKHENACYLAATPKTLEWINSRNAFAEGLAPLFLPTIIPPKPWTQPIGGGYHLPQTRMQLVKTNNLAYLEELHHRRDEMPALYRSLNAIQDTPWKVNARVLETAKAVWDQEITVGSLSGGAIIPLPPFPEEAKEDKEVRRLWKRKAAKVHIANQRQVSKRLQASKIMWVAEKFAPEDRFYFPHQLDFRGRLYAVPYALNPQGNDLSKGLLTFADGKPLGQTGLRWLAIHGANVYGFDKASLDDREKWAHDHRAEIEAVATDPLSQTWWHNADKPWQFLAFCFEFAAAIQEGETYVSTLPVSVDGACNGLQNFSAMLRDEIGGAAVNLVPSEKPQDIYQRVADVVRVKVEARAEAGDLYAIQWLAWGFDRKATKRPVMVLPYGGTRYSSKDFVEEYIKERAEAGDTPPWEKNWEAAMYLSFLIWDSIGEVVVAARSAMTWLQKTALIAAKEGLPVNWTTPVGFPVLQAYRDVKSQSVYTRVGDKIVKLALVSDKTKLSKRRQAQAISPNFVHSMDAACLMLSVCRGLDRGIQHYAMVHDSYGTLAADMDALAVELREAFIDLYSHDVLEDFRINVVAGLSEENAAAVPPCPPKGRLDLRSVRESLYFFA